MENTYEAESQIQRLRRIVENKEPIKDEAPTIYTNRLNTFDQLIKLLASLPEYAPNEPELTTAALTELYNQLQALNAAVVNTFVPLSKRTMYHIVGTTQLHQPPQYL